MPSTDPMVRSVVRRVALIASRTLVEALRLRLTILLGMGGAGLVLLAHGLRHFNFGATELKFIADFGLGAIDLTCVLLAALATAHLFFRDLDGGLTAIVLTRAVRRGEFIAGKLLGVALVLAWFVSALALVLAGLIAWRGVQLGAGPGAVPLVLQAGALVWLKATLVAAMTLAVCSYAGSALFASVAGLLLALAGHLRSILPPDGWRSALRAWPDLGLFAPETGFAEQATDGPRLLWLTGYWLAYLVLFTGVASYVFRRREL